MYNDTKWRWPQNVISRISQQPSVRSYSNLKLNFTGIKKWVEGHEMKTTSKGRRPPMEDDIEPKRTSKYKKYNISATNGQMLLKLETCQLFGLNYS